MACHEPAGKNLSDVRTIQHRMRTMQHLRTRSKDPGAGIRNKSKDKEAPNHMNYEWNFAKEEDPTRMADYSSLKPAEAGRSRPRRGIAGGERNEPWQCTTLRIRRRRSPSSKASSARRLRRPPREQGASAFRRNCRAASSHNRFRDSRSGSCRRMRKGAIPPSSC